MDDATYPRIFPNPDYIQKMVEHLLPQQDGPYGSELFGVGYVLGVAHSAHLLVTEAYGEKADPALIDRLMAAYTKSVALAVLRAFENTGRRSDPLLDFLAKEGRIFNAEDF